ncbi:FkbM family methyltransferase [Xanthobacter dioxanivorans]|uniref:FkbM family methyltransferase n=1 Tax=Xanthobacter dioxanivorans TaxID=2528964 RepID=A0A974PKA7_9HYPH|nr:FkbM family methyltransferase [Xanthobacter dioxanivorans]QRG05157.1 FkbM family methyltransferase [Xanthobacter dioxanivorans]
MSMLNGVGQMTDTVTSGHEEQSLVASFFAGKVGYFVEVGAYDPVYQSQTYHLELGGWDGLLIEPLPDLADNLRRSRRAQVRQCACVAPQQAAAGHIALLERRGNSTVRFDPRKVTDELVIDVPASTLDCVLEDAGIERLDYLSVDVEGAEPDVLRGLDLSRYRPKLILVDDLTRFGETTSLLRRGGYRLVRRTGHNAWFVPREERFPLGLDGRLQLAWTYGIGRMLRRIRR